MEDEEDPVTETGTVTDRDPATNTDVADKSGATGPADKDAATAKAKPKINQLFIYDQDLGDDFPTAIRDAYYSGATLVKISDWSDIKAALAKYSEIKTLIFDTHSTPGDLLIGGNSPTPTEQRNNLKATGVKVTGQIIFEGCEIMGDPAGVAKLVSGIAGPGARVSGYTLYSITQPIMLDLDGNNDADGIRAALDPHARFLLPGSPSPTSLAGTTGTVTFYKRWFRADLNSNPIPDVPTGSFPPKGIHTRDDMTPLKIATQKEAADLRADFTGPVPPVKFVTVTDIPTVAGP